MPTAFMEANYAADPNSMNYSTDCQVLIACYTAQLQHKAEEHSLTVRRRLNIPTQSRARGIVAQCFFSTHILVF